MSERKLKTTHETNEEQIKKTREYMERMKKTGKEYNPAPKTGKSNDGKVQK
jgi:hypothetical protein|tara:strand:+ start:1364 stop:1516 length:153 start_codon:yes stop_codon:yes gene_type:complete